MSYDIFLQRISRIQRPPERVLRAARSPRKRKPPAVSRITMAELRRMGLVLDEAPPKIASLSLRSLKL